MQDTITVFWFRRDLRLQDNTALYHALQQQKNILPIFIFDTNILDKLEDRADARVSFIYETITDLKQQLQKLGSDVQVHYGDPVNIFKVLLQTYSIQAVYTNKDYEGYGIHRDAAIEQLLIEYSIPFYSYKDQVIFECSEVTKDDGLPYTVFTPYSKKWKAKLTTENYKIYPTEKHFANFYKTNASICITLEAMHFTKSTLVFPAKELDTELVKKYSQQRDIPSIQGTSRLGLHLRFGTISIRQLVAKALPLNETYLNELIWRDFYHQITYHFPHINEGHSFKRNYDQIAWRNAPEDFEKWCMGKTGYPIVDAGMRELNTTGFMHNRVRMIVASFLIKHLLIDWRLGEAYFAQKLLDFDFAANNGGWQWASSSGCDAAPYFRIFNPYLQTKKFDPELQYIKKWVPEFEDFTKYPTPIVDHEFARKRCLEVYSKALKG
jgi:deoxyribodipyrimidine photo-lyase